METTVTFSKETNKRSYADIKHEQLQKESTIRFYGEPIDYGSGSVFNIKDIKGGFFGIYDWCLCVQDSPDNPCPCGKNEILWVPIKHLLSSGMDEEKKRYYFDIAKEADLQIERLQSVHASEYANFEKDDWLAFNISRNGFSNYDLLKILEKILRTPPTFPIPEDDGKPGISEKGVKDTIKKLVKAFEIGLAIGTAADKELDLSDKISDLLCKLTGKC